jgi:hypothetical protein
MGRILKVMSALRSEMAKLEHASLDALESLIKKRKPSLINQLVLLVADDDPRIQVRATWLLKRLAEEKIAFSDNQLVAIFDSVSTLAYWEARLHVCQLLGHVKIPKGCERKVAGFLERSVTENNKFLRAWAYSGFCELARQRPEYREYALEHLDRADTDKSAAVKARVRNIRESMKERF